MQSKLKPCPFCGTKAIRKDYGTITVAGCPNLQCFIGSNFATRISKWNKRTPLPQDKYHQRLVDMVRELTKKLGQSNKIEGSTKIYEDAQALIQEVEGETK